jgi:hypothetical protein
MSTKLSFVFQTSYPGASSLLFLLLTVACLGCGSKSSTLARVHGKVELDGRPLAKGNISTIPTAGRGARGLIENGEFELSTFSTNDGATPGVHQVAILAYENTGGGAESGPSKPLVPQRYLNAATSELTIEVKAGEVNTPTLKLTSQ